MIVSYSFHMYRQYRHLAIEFYDMDLFSKDYLVGVTEFNIDDLKMNWFLPSQEILLENSKTKVIMSNIFFEIEYYDDNDLSDEEEWSWTSIRSLEKMKSTK